MELVCDIDMKNFPVKFSKDQSSLWTFTFYLKFMKFKDIKTISLPNSFSEFKALKFTENVHNQISVPEQMSL